MRKTIRKKAIDTELGERIVSGEMAGKTIISKCTNATCGTLWLTVAYCSRDDVNFCNTWGETQYQMPEALFLEVEEID